MHAGLKELEPRLAAAGAEPVGKAVVGTVFGDLHDIGKNPVSYTHLEGQEQGDWDNRQCSCHFDDGCRLQRCLLYTSQLMALATGAATHKLKYGHRGGNHPVKDLRTGRVYISSQNHGYVVDDKSVDPEIAAPAFVNVNDETNEGLQ